MSQRQWLLLLTARRVFWVWGSLSNVRNYRAIA